MLLRGKADIILHFWKTRLEKKRKKGYTTLK